MKAIVPIIFLSLISLTSPSQAGILDWLSEIFTGSVEDTNGSTGNGSTGAHTEKTASDLPPRTAPPPPPPPPTPSTLQSIQPIVTPAGDAPAQLERPTIPSRSSIAPILKSGSARTQLVAPLKKKTTSSSSFRPKMKIMSPARLKPKQATIAPKVTPAQRKILRPINSRPIVEMTPASPSKKNKASTSEARLPSNKMGN